MRLVGEVISIISIKGGVGKTTIVTNLAAVFAREFKRKTLVIDCNISAPNLGLHVGIPEAEITLKDVLEDKILAREAIYRHEYGFDIIPSSIKGTSADPSKLKDKLIGLKKHYDLILLDTSPTINKELLAAMQASDKMFVVTTPDRVTMEMTMRATRVAKEKGAEILGIILNRVRNKKYEIDITKVESKAKTPVVAQIRESYKINESLHRGIPIVLTNPHSKATIEFKKLAAALIDEKYAEPTLLQKIVNYILEDWDNFRQHKFKKKFAYYK